MTDEDEISVYYNEIRLIPRDEFLKWYPDPTLEATKKEVTASRNSPEESE